MRLAELSAVAGTAKRENRQNACGGIMTITLLPILTFLYGVVWFNDWFNGNLGALQETEVNQLQYGTGYKMDGRQELYCLASSGCWYTKFADAECPPKKAVESLAQRASSLVSIFETGKSGPRDFNLPEKRCAYAARYQKLEGVCVYSTPDPIDKLTITWHTGTKASDTFGVGLKTQAMRNQGKSNYRGVNEQSTQAAVAGLAGRWFNWRTDGGGRGYKVSTTGTEVHYGEVELQVLRYRRGTHTHIHAHSRTFTHTEPPHDRVHTTQRRPRRHLSHAVTTSVVVTCALRAHHPRC